MKIDLTKEEIEWLIKSFEIDSGFFELKSIANSIFNKLKEAKK